MALWDRPRHARVALRENVFLDAYGENPQATERALRAYAGDGQVEEWQRGGALKMEPYRGDKRGLELNYERIAKDGEVPLPEVPERLRVKAIDDDSPGSRRVEKERLENQGIRVERNPEKNQIIININLAELEAPGKNPSPRMQEEYRSTLNTVMARVDTLERRFAERDAQIEQAGPAAASGRQEAPSQDRRVAVQQAAAAELPGATSPERRAAVERGVAVELEVTTGHPTVAGTGHEFRGTITEAIEEAEKRHGVFAFASADWAKQARLRVESPRDLAETIERVRAQIAPEAKEEKVYVVRKNGIIHNTVTHRDEYVPVDREVALVAMNGDGRRLDLERPSVEPASPTRGAPMPQQEEREVSVSIN
jgi:hypothetical protein